MTADRTLQSLNMLNDSYEEQLFRLAISELTADAEGIALLEGGGLNQYEAPSEAALKRFASRAVRYIAQTEKASGRKEYRPHRILGKAAIALLAAVALFAILMLTVDAFRVRVLNLLIKTEPKYTSVQLTDEAAAPQEGRPVLDWKNAYVPTYIPDGYAVSDVLNSDACKKIVFANPKTSDSFQYVDYSNMDFVTLDSENADLVRQVKINGSDGTLIVKNTNISLAWAQDHHLFMILGNLGQDEAIKTAENVKFIP
jgi:hypothetical protein